MSDPIDRPTVIVLAGGLREARTRRGISVRRLAHLADLHPAALSAYELGQRTPPDYVVALILGVLRAPRAEYEQLLDLARRTHERDLITLDGRRETLLRATYEQRSTHVLEWCPALIPEPSLPSPSEATPRYTYLIGEAAGQPDAVIIRRGCVNLVPATGCAPGLLEPFTLYERNGSAFALAVRHHQASVFFTDEAALMTFAKIAESLEQHAAGIAAKS